MVGRRPSAWMSASLGDALCRPAGVVWEELGVPVLAHCSCEALGTTRVGRGQGPCCPGPGTWPPVARGRAARSPAKPSSAARGPFCGLSCPVWAVGRRVRRCTQPHGPPVSSAAELMERAAVPPLWPALYPPGRSPLHHAQQLQLFSQQHFLRQQELLYLQQQAAQALELQRSAQLVVSGAGGRGALGTPPLAGEAHRSASRNPQQLWTVREKRREPGGQWWSLEEPSGQRGQCEQGPEVDRAWRGGGGGAQGAVWKRRQARRPCESGEFGWDSQGPR